MTKPQSSVCMRREDGVLPEDSTAYGANCVTCLLSRPVRYDADAPACFVYQGRWATRYELNRLLRTARHVQRPIFNPTRSRSEALTRQSGSAQRCGLANTQ